jgi:hypothetical protein
MVGRAIYVETLINAGIAQVWRHSQDPKAHARWDLRFTRIDDLPGDGSLARFRYSTRLAPGLVIAGTGVSVGERSRPDGSRTSALRFASNHPLSLIRVGAGYWRYVPTGAGVRFLTGYDYRPGWGCCGVLADWAFRPVMGWATAWSFDRLRLWLERGIRPRRALIQGLAEVVARLAGCVAVAWWAGTPFLAAAALLALLLPALPTTPSARRCRRRPPDRVVAKPPSTLDSLERP